MKHVSALLLLPLLLGCRKDHSSYEQRIVTAQIRKSMEKVGQDFGSYMPVSWDTQAVSRRDSLLWYIGKVPAPAELAALPRYRRKNFERALTSPA